MKLEINLTEVLTFAREFQPSGVLLHFTVHHGQAQFTAFGSRTAGSKLNRPIEIIANEKRPGALILYQKPRSQGFLVRRWASSA